MEILYIALLTIFVILQSFFIVLLFISKDKQGREKNNEVEVLIEKLEKNQRELKDYNVKTFSDIKEGILQKVVYMQENFQKSLDNVKKSNDEHLTKEFEKVIRVFKENIENLEKLGKEFKGSEKIITNSIKENLKYLNEQVELKLEKGFKQADETFKGVLKSLGEIDKAQKNIENISGEIVSLQEILSDKKSRGTYGEVQLSMILKGNFGEGNKDLYETQVKVSDGNVVDAVLKMQNKKVPIDSKFPLENYKKMLDKNISKFERDQVEKKFVGDVKKHIKDIHDKYIIGNQDADMAIMFIPSEAVFAEINAYHEDIIKFAIKNKITISSPTTLMALIKLMIVVDVEEKRRKYSKIIHQELNKLSEDFARYSKRWENLQKSINKVSREVKDLNITSDKITKKFSKVSSVEIPEIEDKD